jgi:hypothetical protein
MSFSRWVSHRDFPPIWCSLDLKDVNFPVLQLLMHNCFHTWHFVYALQLWTHSFVRDVLLGLMKRLVTLHASSLKVLITSATLDGKKVSKFFSNCPVLNVPGKLYRVEILYSNERPTSYVESSLKTALGMIKPLIYSWCNDNVFYSINLCILFLLIYRFVLVHWNVFL